MAERVAKAAAADAVQMASWGDNRWSRRGNTNFDERGGCAGNTDKSQGEGHATRVWWTCQVPQCIKHNRNKPDWNYNDREFFGLLLAPQGTAEAVKDQQRQDKLNKLP